MEAKMKKLNYSVVTASFLFVTTSQALATDHHYTDNNSYFASKYHHRHAHHWQNSNSHKHSKPTHWGRHHHHGIKLDGNDGRP